MGSFPKISSVGEIARQENVAIHKVSYVIRSRNIKPTLIAGGRYFYDEPTTRRIGSELRRIEETSSCE